MRILNWLKKIWHDEEHRINALYHELEGVVECFEFIMADNDPQTSCVALREVSQKCPIALSQLIIEFESVQDGKHGKILRRMKFLATGFERAQNAAPGSANQIVQSLIKRIELLKLTLQKAA